MIAKSVALLLLFSPSLYGQYTQEKNWRTDSLRGSVHTVSAFIRTYYSLGPDSSYVSTTYRPDGQAVEFLLDDFWTSYCYTTAGKTACITEDYKDIHYSYDEEGRLLEFQDSDFSTGRYTYDDQGRAVEAQRTEPGSRRTHISRARYDSLGRMMRTENMQEITDDSGRKNIRWPEYRRYYYSGPDSCVETPAGTDCSCASIATVVEETKPDTPVVAQHCYTKDGKIRWRESFREYDKDSYPLRTKFSMVDEKNRNSMIISRGVAYSATGIYHHSVFVNEVPDTLTYDSTVWRVVFPSYDQHDNYTGEKIYLYNSLADFRNRTGRLAGEIAVAYVYDNHENWIYRSIHNDGVLRHEETRIITYFPDAADMADEPDKGLR